MSTRPLRCLAAVPAFVLVLCFVPIAVAQPSAPPNLLANPGFEAGTTGPAGWHLGMEGRGAGSATWVADDPHSGRHCVRVELKEPGDYWMADQTTAPGSAVPGRLYRLCGWYRSVPGAGVHPCVYFEDVSGKFLSAVEFTPKPSANWAFYDTVFRAVAGADHFRVQLRAQGVPGAVWYDDVTLCDAAAETAYQEDLARRLEGEAGKLPGWWCALVPGEGELRLRMVGVRKLRVAAAVAGDVQPAKGALVGAEVSRLADAKGDGGATAVVPILRDLKPGQAGQLRLATADLDLARLAPKTWQRGVEIDLVARGLGDRVRALVAVEPMPELRRGLLEARAQSIDESAAGADLPWAARLLGDAGPETARLARDHLYANLRAILGAGTRPATVTASSLVKRRPDQWVDDIAAGKLQAGAPAEIMCAGNEAESFQCLFLPTMPRPLTLTARLTELRGQDGAVIPASAGKVQMEEYVQAPDGRWWPDPLMAQQPFRASHHGPPVFWATVRVPTGQRPGVYRGKLLLAASPGGKAAVDVVVRVPGFSLPKQTHLNTSFWIFRGQIRRYFDLPGDPSPEVYGKYLDLATSHGLSPIDVLEGPCSPLVKVYRDADGSLSYDWSAWDVYLRRIMAGGANTIHLGWTHWMGRFFSDEGPVEAIDRATGKKVTIAPPAMSEAHLRYLGDYIKAAKEHVRSLGFKGLVYIQLFDEPQPSSYPEVAKVLAGLGKYAPGVPRLMDAVYPKNLPADLRDNIDLWCPLSPGLPGNFDQQRAEGKTLWWYVCCGPRPPYANYFIEQPAMENRMLMIQTWQHHLTGVLYWGLNYWLGWGTPIPKERFPAGPWKTTGSPMGDGYFIYPGARADEPLSSVRLEILGDSIEDYEYLWMLADRSKGREVPAEVERLLAVPPTVSKSLTDYTRDPAVLEAYRERLAYWIERLGPR